MSFTVHWSEQNRKVLIWKMNLMVAITYISIISASVHWVAVTVSFISNRFTFLLGKKKASSTLSHFSYHHFSYPVLSFSENRFLNETTYLENVTWTTKPELHTLFIYMYNKKVTINKYKFFENYTEYRKCLIRLISWFLTESSSSIFFNN